MLPAARGGRTGCIPYALLIYNIIKPIFWASLFDISVLKIPHFTCLESEVNLYFVPSLFYRVFSQAGLFEKGLISHSANASIICLEAAVTMSFFPPVLTSVRRLRFPLSLYVCGKILHAVRFVMVVGAWIIVSCWTTRVTVERSPQNITLTVKIISSFLPR